MKYVHSKPHRFLRPFVVAEDYRLQRNYRGSGVECIEPVGKLQQHLLLPDEHPEIPFELAKLRGGEHVAVLRFAKDYGQLGAWFRPSWRLVDCPDISGNTRAIVRCHTDKRIDYDPLLWIQAHAHTMHLCLTLHRLLLEAPLNELGACLGQLDENRTPPPPWASLAVNQKPFRVDVSVRDFLTLIETLPDLSWKTVGPHLYPFLSTVAVRGSIQRVCWIAIKKKHSTGDLAQRILQDLINWNLAGVCYRLEPRKGKDRFFLGCDALVEIAYWHLADAIASTKDRACEVCGSFFFQQDPRQRFCPAKRPGEDSVCANRKRIREFRRRQLLQGKRAKQRTGKRKGDRHGKKVRKGSRNR